MFCMCPHSEQGHVLLARLGALAGQDLARFLLHHPCVPRTTAQIFGEFGLYWRRERRDWLFCQCDEQPGEPVAEASYRSAYLAALAEAGLEVACG